MPAADRRQAIVIVDVAGDRPSIAEDAGPPRRFRLLISRVINHVFLHALDARGGCDVRGDSAARVKGPESRDKGWNCRFGS